MRGAGTLLNVVAVLAGAGIGVLLQGRLPRRTRDVVTDGLGLVTLLIAGLSARAVVDADLEAAVGTSAPVLIVLGSVVLGGLVGSLLRLETRLEEFGAALQQRLAGETGSEARRRFVEGFITSSLIFCVGPLAILGALSDGLGHGIDQLALKSTLDFFAAIAFAASFGWGVAASAIPVGALQGALTVAGLFLGSLLPDAQVAALTATGGLLLVGVALRLLDLKPLPVADLLPALAIAPVLTTAVEALR